jgi:putative aminopeptidase FrvX
VTDEEPTIKHAIKETLAALTALDGLPGFEQPVVAELERAFNEVGAEVTVDRMGNVYAEYRGSGDGPHVMVTAHSDEVGAIVRYVDERGFLRIDGLGGVAPVLLVGRRVRIAGNLGVIGIRPVHLLTPDERLKAPPIDQLYVDVGAAGAAEVAAMGIRVGSPVAYVSALETYTNEDRLCGKAIDNRLGCSVLLQLFRELGGRAIRPRLTGVVAVQEEVGLRGATVAARRVAPDCAIVIDTVPVADTPDVAPGRMVGAIGAGPMVVIAAAGGASGHIAHPDLVAAVEGAAAAVDVPLQRVTTMGYAVTDAGAIHLRNEGIPTVALGLPRRYSHSPVCTFDINDAAGAVRVLERCVSDMGDGDAA